jgi:fatty acid kinase fatty acid binding subunit
MKISIVTDSTCDLPHNLAVELGITVVPNILVINGETVEDNPDFSRQEFYAHLPAMDSIPTTSTASPGEYTRVYENLLTQGADQVISVHASRLLSGIYNSASVAAQAFSNRVHVIDSQFVSLGLGFQVLEVTQAVAAGISVHSILDMLAQLPHRVRVIAMLNTLEYVKHSGRVSWAKASFSQLLHIKSFVEVRDGNVFRLGEVRTRKKGITKLLEYIKSNSPYKRLAILHTNAEADALNIMEMCSSLSQTSPLTVNVTTVIGTHVGPNGLGFAAITV